MTCGGEQARIDGRGASGDSGPVLPPRPEPPRPEDCCGSGCVRCIYTIYDDALLAWERDVERIVAEANQSGQADPSLRSG